MPEPIGSFIEDGDSGKSAVDPNPESVDGNQGRISGPEIINGFEAESPTTERIAGTGDTPGSGKRRGRPPGARNATTKTPSKESVRLESLKISDLLYSTHLMLSEMTKVPEFELDKEESEKLGAALADVAKYYTTAFDPKKVAWVHLAVIAGGIYGTRLFAFKNRKANQRALNPQPIRPTPKPAVVNTRPQASPTVNGAAPAGVNAETGKLEIDPGVFWSDADNSL